MAHETDPDIKTAPVTGPDIGRADADQSAQLDSRVQAKLGSMLKQHYDDLISAPIPDQFLVLLAELEAKEQSSGR